MKFELQPAYPSWPENTRKSLHVDQEAFVAIKRICDAADVDDRLSKLLPADVLVELKRPMYTGAHLLFGMDVVIDRADYEGDQGNGLDYRGCFGWVVRGQSRNVDVLGLDHKAG